jgi:hypothetical protein
MDDICDLTIANFSLTTNGEEYFCFNEQSSIQVLRELPIETGIKVANLFSERHRISQKVDAIKKTGDVKGFFEIVLPLVEHGNFPCTDITIIIDNQIKLSSHDDGEVHLVSTSRDFLHDLIKKMLVRQHYDPGILTQIINKPNLYHRLEKPNKIIASYKSFDEVIEAM